MVWYVESQNIVDEENYLRPESLELYEKIYAEHCTIAPSWGRDSLAFLFCIGLQLFQNDQYDGISV